MQWRKIKGKVDRNCLECNAIFKTNPYEVKIGNAKYCSWSCSAKVRNREIKKAKAAAKQTIVDEKINTCTI